MKSSDRLLSTQLSRDLFSSLAAPTAKATGLAPRVYTDIYEAGGIYDANDAYDAFVARGGMTRAQMAAAHPTYVLPSEVTDDAEDNFYDMGWPVAGRPWPSYTICWARERSIVWADQHLGEFTSFRDPRG